MSDTENNLFINLFKEEKGTYSTPEKGSGIACCQFDVDLDQKLIYYEITIQKSGKGTPNVCIGFAPGKREWTTKSNVGQHNGAIGWNGDNGQIYNDSSSNGPTIDRYKVGDTVGACWNVVRDEVFFTKNGQKQKTFLGARSRTFVGQLYPTLTCNGGAQLQFSINQGKDKFLYNLSSERDPDEEDDSQPLSELNVTHENLVVKDLSFLFKSSTNSDIKVKIGEEVVPAHKIILAARSKKLHSLVLSSNEVVMNDKFSNETNLLTLEYIYTGKVKLTSQNWENVLKCADFYQVAGLRRNCFDFMIRSLNKDTVLETLTKAQHGKFDFDATDLIKRIVIFLEKNAHEVIKTKSFLELTGDVVQMIMKNNNSAFDEVDAFNACLTWAKNQQETTKQDLATILKDISPHIRYPLMTPSELVRIVKPSKVAPVDLYTQAVEYHAYPEHFTKIIKNNIQFTKRFKTFTGSSLIDERSANTLLSFLPPSKKGWECIYKGTKDGFNTQTFHSKCDNKGETVVIIQSDNGNIFGGYSPLPWANTNAYTYDTRTFLFLLVDKNGKGPVKIANNTNNKHSIYNASSYGATFGGGHDLYICNQSNTVKSSYSNLGHSFKVPKHAYGSNEAKNFLAGSYNFLTKEIECFSKIE